MRRERHGEDEAVPVGTSEKLESRDPRVHQGVICKIDVKGRWRSWLSHLSNTQKVLSSILGRLMFLNGSPVGFARMRLA